MATKPLIPTTNNKVFITSDGTVFNENGSIIGIRENNGTIRKLTREETLRLEKEQLWDFPLGYPMEHVPLNRSGFSMRLAKEQLWDVPSDIPESVLSEPSSTDKKSVKTPTKTNPTPAQKDKRKAKKNRQYQNRKLRRNAAAQGLDIHINPETGSVLYSDLSPNNDAGEAILAMNGGMSDDMAVLNGRGEYDSDGEYVPYEDYDPNERDWGYARDEPY